MWRPLRFLPHVLLTLVLAAALLFALATRFPDAEILADAEQWPVIGPLAQRFRSEFLPSRADPASPPPATDTGESGAGPAPEVELIQVVDPDLVGVKPKIWAPAGTSIYRQPDLAGKTWTRVEHLFPLSLLEQRGDWYRVRFGNLHTGWSKGWVYLPDYREPTEEQLMAPALVLPLAPSPLQPETEEVARRWLGAGVRGGRCGPWQLLTDVDDREVLEMCERIAARVERAYVERYGLPLVGTAAETVLLFRDEAVYRGFRAEVSPELGGVAHAAPARGYGAVPVGRQTARQVSVHLVHELTHLLNRRALGPALPPWLDEGLARDLSLAGVEPGGEEGRAAQPGTVVSLAALLELDQRSFQESAERNYRSAAEWIRYLLDGPDPALSQGLRDFFEAVSEGEPITEELLLAHLASDATELETGFRVWRQR